MLGLVTVVGQDIVRIICTVQENKKQIENRVVFDLMLSKDIISWRDFGWRPDETFRSNCSII